MKAPYGTPSTCTMREPIAAPNTTKYRDVEMTGEAILCISVRQVRAISKRYSARIA